MLKHLTRSGLIGLSAALILTLLLATGPLVSADTGINWTGQYWSNTTFSGGVAFTRIDPAINFNWAAGSPDVTLAPRSFSVRWTLTQNFLGGLYTFRAGAQGSVRAYIDNNVIIDQFHDTSSFQTYTTLVNLGAGNHNLQVDYSTSQSGLSGVLLDWTSGSIVVNPGGTTYFTPAPNVVVATAHPTTMKAEIRVDLANVRSDPSTTNPLVGQVYFGDIYKVIASDTTGNWYLIVLANGSQVWIARRNIYLFAGSTDYLPVLQVSAAAAAAVPPGPLANVQAVATVNLIVRDGPSRRDTNKVGAINQGESFKVIALSRNHAWAQISGSGLNGWVFVPYINVTFGDLGQLPVHN